MELNEYLNPNFNLENIDRFYARSSILFTIQNEKSLLNGRLLDVGCGIMPYKNILLFPQGVATEYIGLDFEKPITKGYGVVKPDLTWDGINIPLPNNSVDSILLTEVLEHCFNPQNVLSECYRVLNKNGSILITVPFLWPLHDIPYDEYRYTPYSLEKMLKIAGFNIINIKGLGGWNASLGQMLGLWINRSGISGWKRKFIFLIFKPFIHWLYKKDIKPTNFNDNVHMINGLSIVANKL